MNETRNGWRVLHFTETCRDQCIIRHVHYLCKDVIYNEISQGLFYKRLESRKCLEVGISKKVTYTSIVLYTQHFNNLVYNNLNESISNE